VRYLEVVELTTEEVEALRLRNMKDLEQEEAAKKNEHFSKHLSENIIFGL
jgi:predicted DNA-binding protein (UPF0251 family)